MSRIPPIDVNSPDVLIQIRSVLELLAKDIDRLSGTGNTRIRVYGDLDVRGRRIIGLEASTLPPHASRHENGGVDEISVTGLSGELADAQPPKTHSNTAHSTPYQATSEKNAASGYAGLSSASRTTKGVDTTDDIIVDLATKGLVLKDTQGTPHYWRVTISNLGALVITDLGTTKP